MVHRWRCAQKKNQNGLEHPGDILKMGKFTEKVPKIEGKHVKHSPNISPVLKTEYDSTFLVKSSTPFVSMLKQITKMLNKFDKLSRGNGRFKSGQYRNVKYLTVKGMGRCIEKTLAGALVFQEQHYKVEISTGSVEVVDEFVKERGEADSDDEGEAVFQKRDVSYVEVHIWIKRDS